MSNPAGYSGTPLARKLGIKENYQIHIFQPPDYFWTLFDRLQDGLKLVDHPAANSLDYLHFFVTKSDDLHIAMSTMLHWLKKDGALWISWPKKTSGVPTNVDKWQVLDAGRVAGLVDVKVAAIDDTWSGQKFMYRRRDR